MAYGYSLEAATADMLSEQAQRLLQAVAAFKTSARQESKNSTGDERGAAAENAGGQFAERDHSRSPAFAAAALPTMRAAQAMLPGKAEPARRG